MKDNKGVKLGSKMLEHGLTQGSVWPTLQ